MANALDNWHNDRSLAIDGYHACRNNIYLNEEEVVKRCLHIILFKKCIKAVRYSAEGHTK